MRPVHERPVVIAFNPIAGAGRAARLAAELADALRGFGIAAELAPSQVAGDVTRIAAEHEERCRCFAVVGGDGTAREAAEGLVQLATPLAILPSGTANVLAGELGLGPDPWRLAQLIAADSVRLFDVFESRAAGEPLRRGMLFAAAGFDAEVVRRFSRWRAERLAAGAAPSQLGKAAYARPLVEALAAWRPAPLEIRLDGAPLSGGPFAWAIVTNTRHFGGLFTLGPSIDPTDGRLDLVALPASGLGHLLLTMATAFAGCLDLCPGVAARAVADEVTIASPAGIPVQLDGDPHGATPLTVRRLARRLPVVAPALAAVPAIAPAAPVPTIPQPG
jgi:diacylglycerol kinase family enzyme